MQVAFTRRAMTTAAFLCAAWVPNGWANESAVEMTVLDGRHWAVSSNGQDITWPDADAYCADLHLGGFSDWQLPTLEALETLQDASTESGIRAPIQLDSCCLWSRTSLEDLAAEDGDEIAGEPGMYRWGFMFDGALRYYAVHVFEDGQALCTRED
jgi:hypothetical protein